MQITAEEYHLLRNKLLPKNITIGIDSLYRIYFLMTDDHAETLDKLRVRQIIKQYTLACDLDTLSKAEMKTLVGLLIKCIKN